MSMFLEGEDPTTFNPHHGAVQITRDALPLIGGLVVLYVAVCLTAHFERQHPYLLQLQKFARPFLPNLRLIWNLTLSYASLLGAFHLGIPFLLRLIQKGPVAVSCEANSPLFYGFGGFAGYIFTVGKTVELLDTVFLILGGRRLTLLHCYHHASVLPFSLWLYLHQNPLCIPFASMNLFVHGIMYGYFGLNDLIGDTDSQFRAVWGGRITVLQCSQFVFALSFITTAAIQNFLGHECTETYKTTAVSAFVYGSYLMLFLRFAESKYGWFARLEHYLSITFRSQSKSASHASKTNINTTMPWQRPGLSLEKRFEHACKLVIILSHAATTEELLTLYGYYKLVNFGAAPENSDKGLQGRDLYKRKAWIEASNLSPVEAQEKYIEILDKLADRKRSKASSQAKTSGASSNIGKASKMNDPFVLYPIKIAGMGSYLPERIVSNQEIQRLNGNDDYAVEATRTGVTTRHFCSEEETMITMSAEAIRRAADSASISLNDIDLILCASGISHQTIPDDACLIQKELGLGESGIRAFSVHGTCLSFMVALDVAGSMMNSSSKYKTVAVVSASKASAGINFTDSHTAGLFGDGAAAAILTQSSGTNAVHATFTETYGCGEQYCQILGGGTHRPADNPSYERLMDKFQMDGESTVKLIGARLGDALDRFIPGLQFGLEHLLVNETKHIDIDWIVPHQASGLALDAMSFFGWPQEKILRTLDCYGNCVAASIPLTLAYGIKSGKIRRGDRVMILGTSAGVSFGGMVFTF